MTGLVHRVRALVRSGQGPSAWPRARVRRDAENRLLKVLALMREDLARPWTLEELAREAHLSSPHFTELCRRQTGMPPLGLLIRLRLQRAMDLLQQRQPQRRRSRARRRLRGSVLFLAPVPQTHRHAALLLQARAVKGGRTGRLLGIYNWSAEFIPQQTSSAIAAE